MENNVTEALAREAAQRGLAALRVNYRNTGAVEGDTGRLPRFEWWNDLEVRNDYTPVLEDARTAISLARRTFELVAVLGYSFGGWVAARAALEGGIATCAAVCPPLGRLDFEALTDARLETMLVFAGRDGLDVPPSPVEARARFPRARILHLDEADHFLLGEEADVARSVLAFVQASTSRQGETA